MGFKLHLFKYHKASKECSPNYLLPLLRNIFAIWLSHSEKLDSRRLAVLIDNTNSPILAMQPAVDLKKCRTLTQQVRNLR